MYVELIAKELSSTGPRVTDADVRNHIREMMNYK